MWFLHADVFLYISELQAERRQSVMSFEARRLLALCYVFQYLFRLRMLFCDEMYWDGFQIETQYENINNRG